jgi:hypothetical protein
MGKLSKLIRLAIVFTVGMYVPCPSSAQTTTGQINGTVADSTGAVIPGVTVTAVNTDTHASRTVQSGSNGEFLITLLPVGNYELDIKKDGFSPLAAKSIKLDVSQSLTINPKLQIGTANVSVDVQADSELLNYSNSTLGTTISEKVVKDLPLNGRNFTQLLTLVPGATPISTSQGANIGTDDGSTVAIPGSSFSNPSINGQQNREVLYLLDGVVNTDFRTTTYTVLPIVDGIDQFKVQSHNDDPAFGSVLGGVVNLITKSGTNTFHGSVWEFLRNSAFNARNPFADVNSDGSPRKVGAFHQNEFGGLFSGPVHIPKLYNGRDKTFFFFAFEGWRYSSPLNTLSNVPTAAEIGGNFQNSVGNTQIFDPTTTTVNGAGTGYNRQAFQSSIIPANRISPQVQSYIQTYFDLPNLTGNPNYNELLALPATNNSNNYQGRIDQIVTKKDTIFFRWSNMFDTVNAPASHKVSNLTDFNGLNIGAGITHVFTPKLVANVDGGRASRAFSFNNISSPGLAPLTQEGFTGLNLYGPVAVNLSAPYGGSGLGSAALRRNSSWSVAGVLNAQVGRHSFSFGTTYINQYRSQHGTGQSFNFANDQTSDPNNPGTTGNSLASALLGFPVSGGFQAQNIIKFSIPTYAVFAGDQWKVTNKLSLNLGLRYDHLNQPNITSGMNNGFNFDTGNWEIGGGKLPAACIVSNLAPCIPGTSTDAATDLAATLGNNGSVAGSHIIVSPSATRAPASVDTDFGPRFGFAYTLNASTVLRGGFGIVYDTLNGISQTLSNSIGEWPAKGSVTHNYNVLGTPLTSVAVAETQVGSPLTTGGPFGDFDYYYSPKEKPIYSEQYNLQLEQSLDRKTLLSIGYVGSVSKRLDYAGTANAAVTPGAGTAAQVQARQPYPYMTTFVYDSTIGAGNYNSLQVKLERQFSQGLQFLASYTWSKSTDTGTSGHFGAENGIGPAVQNYYSPQSNRSVSGYDVPQFLSVSALYELPAGKGKRYFNKGALLYVLGGWQLNTVAQLHSGQPYTLAEPGDIANIGISGGGYERPNLVGNPNLSHPTYLKAFNTAAFAVPVLSFGNVGRNTMRGESYHNDDISLFKHFPIANKATVEFRAEAFNAFNIINYGTPDNNLGDKQAGTINGIAGLPRQFQFALKVSF